MQGVKPCKFGEHCRKGRLCTFTHRRVKGGKLESERGGQGGASQALLSQIVSDDPSLMSGLEKMIKADLDEMSKLVATLIEEEIAKTMAEKQVSL